MNNIQNVEGIIDSYADGPMDPAVRLRELKQASEKRACKIAELAEKIADLERDTASGIVAPQRYAYLKGQLGQELKVAQRTYNSLATIVAGLEAVAKSS